MAVGVYGGDVDFVLGRHFAASVEGDVYNVNGTTATAFGGGLLFFPNAAFHGLYLEPRVAYARPLSEGLLRFDWNSDVFGFGATAGWQWTWDYGFTVRLGGGGMYFLGGSNPASNAVGLTGPELGDGRFPRLDLLETAPRCSHESTPGNRGARARSPLGQPAKAKVTRGLVRLFVRPPWS